MASRHYDSSSMNKDKLSHLEEKERRRQDFYLKHKDEIAAKKRVYYAEHKDYWKEYYRRNKKSRSSRIQDAKQELKSESAGEILA